MEKPVNEKRNKFLVGLFFCAFFVVAFKCSGQLNHRQQYYSFEHGKIITRVQPKKMMSFVSGDQSQDTTRVTIKADSVGNGYYNLNIRVWFSPSMAASGKIKLNFTNGISDELSLETIEEGQMLVDYKFSDRTFIYLKSFFVSSISINNLELNVSDGGMFFQNFFEDF